MSEATQGTVVVVRGSVVDIRFDGRLPPIYSVLRTGAEESVVIEVLAQRDARHVRGIALTPTQGLARGMEVSGLMGQMPSRLGYQPTMGTELSGLEERIANTDTGAFTSIQAVYVPADDFTDPAAVHTFSHLSASIVLSRKRASEGLYPAIDPLQSSSKMATPGIVGERHYGLAHRLDCTAALAPGILIYETEPDGEVFVAVASSMAKCPLGPVWRYFR